MRTVLSNLVLSMLFYIYFVGIYSIFRAVYYFSLLQDTSHSFSEITSSFVTGIRFDSKFITLPMLLFTIIAFLSPLFRVVAYRVQRVSIYTVSYIFILLSTILFFVDYYFYVNFGKRIDFEIFRIFEDESQMLISSIATDYNIMGISLITLLILVAHYFVFKRLLDIRFNLKRPLAVQLSLLILYVIGLAYGVRGSFGTFPLRRDDMYISQNDRINMNVSNPLFSLKEARKNKSKYTLNISKKQIVEKHHISQELFDTLVNDSLFFSQTPNNEWLEQNKPNVVFVLMESMGTYLMNQHSENNNLLGTLAEVLDSCIVFKNFVSATNGTIESLEYLQVATVNKHIARTQYKEKSFVTSVANPFAAKGYTTQYISSGKLGWRNTGNFFKRQNYQTAFGQNYIHQQFDRVEENGWGAHDEYIYDILSHELAKSNAQGKPYFGFGLTISNHTPFSIPSTYEPQAIHLAQNITKHSNSDSDNLYKSLLTFQYANDQLGRFIKQTIQSKYGKNTIIVATGDHNTRKLNKFSESQSLDKLSVPLIMYIPPKYRSRLHIDTSRFGSHKDIFPTIFNLALSNATYANLGNNLLGDTTQSFFGVNGSFAFFKNSAYNASNQRYYTVENRTIHRTETPHYNTRKALMKLILQYDIALYKNALVQP